MVCYDRHMGYAYHELIPAGVLYNSPGLDRKSFAREIDKTGVYRLPKDIENGFSLPPDWGPSQGHNCGLYLLAELLGFKYTKKYLQISKLTQDADGLPLESVRFSMGRVEGKLVYGIREHVKNEVLERRKVCINGVSKGQIERFWISKYVKDVIVDEIIDEDEAYIFPIKAIHKDTYYSLQEDMVKDWPRFDPDFMYDFSPSEGKFLITHEKGKFYWEKRGDKYFIHPKTYDVIPDSLLETWRRGIKMGSLDDMELGFIDLVLTAEALKQKAYYLFKDRGRDHTKRFLDENPKAEKAYSQAVLDQWISFHARDRGMTNNEFLRLHLSSKERK